MYRLFAVLALCLPLLLAARGATADTFEEEPIVGAGAHFAWVVFDALRPDLERATGRLVELHGRYSALGMGCNAGIKIALHNGDHFGFVCCPLADEEVKRKKLRVFPIAREPILIMVNNANPVRGLSAEQVRAIFRGEIANWKDVGGRDEPIVVVTRLHCKKRPGHWKTILPNARAFRPQRLNVSSAAEMEQRIAAFPGAIGHIGATWDFQPDSTIHALRIDGREATADNLRSGHYPFYRDLSAVTGPDPSPDVLTLIDRVRNGDAIQRIVARYQLMKL